MAAEDISIENNTQDKHPKFTIYKPFPGLYAIQGGKGGPVPAELKGDYTKKVWAQAAIDNYLVKKNRVKRTYRKDTPKVENVGETNASPENKS